MRSVLLPPALLALLISCQAPGDAAVESPSDPSAAVPQLTADLADRFAGLAVEGIVREYPNKPGNVIVDEAGVRSPRAMHPAFYGSFDWHSSVHGHWMLIRLLRVGPPQTPQRAQAIQAALDVNLTLANVEAEVAYFNEPGQKSFERMYGWAWALRLAAELHAWNQEVPDQQAVQRWREAVRPLEDHLVAQIPPYLERLQWPIRIGEHRDTGFALGQILDYADIVGNRELREVVAQRARDYYLEDRNYPARFEPSGEDFFSSGLNTADLMRRVLPAEQYSDWLDGFLPGLANGEVASLLEPVGVTDVTDGKLVHLAGLNLHRAWCWLGIASALPAGDARIAICETAAAAHYDAGLGYVFSGDYAGEHWLASFAVYLVTGSGRD